jgi:DNA helicase-2/ATP-dependent DNA helicase PcrA
LWLTYANARYRFGNLVQNEPSRFLEELPAEYVDQSYAGGGLHNKGSYDNMGNAFQRMHRGFGNEYNDIQQAERKYGPPPVKKEQSSKPTYVAPAAVPKVVEHKPSGNFIPSDTSNLQVGQKIEHQKFGFGEVTKMEGSNHNPIATVKFEHNGEKKIMLNYAKLRIVE